jgi:hypothetical protein
MDSGTRGLRPLGRNDDRGVVAAKPRAARREPGPITTGVKRDRQPCVIASAVVMGSRWSLCSGRPQAEPEYGDDNREAVVRPSDANAKHAPVRRSNEMAMRRRATVRLSSVLRRPSAVAD